MNRLARLSLALVLLLTIATPAYGGGTHAKEASSRRAQAVVGQRSTMRMASAETDDDVPGVPLVASPVTGTLDELSDCDDVFAIYLNAGERLSASITGDAGTDFDLYLFGPGTATVFTSDGPLKAADGGSYPDGFTYIARATGTFYLDAYAYGGSGSYSFSYEVVDAATEAANPDNDIPGVPAPASPIVESLDDYADCDDVYQIYLTAGQTLCASITGDETTDFDVFLYGPNTSTIVDSSEWLADGATDSYPDGFTYVAPTTGTYYIDAWAYMGSGSYRLSYAVKTKPYVRTPIAPSRMYKSRYYPVYGWLKPAHTAGTYPVRIYKWRKTSSGAWKSYGYVKAKAYDYFGYTKYSRTMRLRYAGSWRLRAYASSDSSHTAAWSSGYEYVTVK